MNIRQGITEFYIVLLCDVIMYPTFCVLKISILVTANEKIGEVLNNYRGLEVRKGARGPYVAYDLFLFFGNIINCQLHKLTLSNQNQVFYWRHPDVLKFNTKIIEHFSSNTYFIVSEATCFSHVKTETCSLTQNKIWCVWRKMCYYFSNNPKSLCNW